MTLKPFAWLTYVAVSLILTSNTPGQITFEHCFPPPTEEGNAADDYAYVLKNIQPDELIVSPERGRKGAAIYNIKHPLLDRMVAGSRKKNCNFYPDHYPFPKIGEIEKMQYPDMQLAFDVAMALCARAKDHLAGNDYEASHRDVNAVYWFGKYLRDEYASLGQSTTGMYIMTQAFSVFYGLTLKGHKEHPNYYAMNLLVPQVEDRIREEMKQRAPWPYIEDAELALKVFQEKKPEWYLPNLLVLSGSFARLMNMKIPEEDYELASIPDTFAFYCINKGRNDAAMVIPEVIRERYRERAKAILEAIQAIAENPPSPILGDMARQVSQLTREDLIHVAMLLKSGVLVNGPGQTRRDQAESAETAIADATENVTPNPEE